MSDDKEQKVQNLMDQQIIAIQNKYGDRKNVSLPYNNFAIDAITVNGEVVIPALQEIAKNTNKTVEPKTVILSKDKDTSYSKNTATLTINMNDIERLSTKDLSKKIASEIQKAHTPEKENSILKFLKEANPFRADATNVQDGTNVSPSSPIKSAALQPKGGREGIV